MPSNFQFAFKGTDRITIKKFPNLPRYGHRAGVVNENFLNAEFFSNTFLRLSFFSIATNARRCSKYRLVSGEAFYGIRRIERRRRLGLNIPAFGEWL